ncbi:hypothetical protein ACP49_11635 [Clostridium botulinum]|nr:hypothetical protein ACP53_06525 [Clostridium botulinum]KON01191.1 hypothetical protein ACP49_11635 [Clostridium botulinum]OPD24718.1 hypothetical protein AL710_04135 [Clostridium botulinum]OPD34273.1 hypothetical protein AL713_02620 [Clostridium botulinum]OPD37091.1 hypothetical protein AL714_10335 [Clostridium botulinum]
MLTYRVSFFFQFKPKFLLSNLLNPNYKNNLSYTLYSIIHDFKIA